VTVAAESDESPGIVIDDRDRRAREALRQLPSVNRLAAAVVKQVLTDRRAELLAGAQDEVDLAQRAVSLLSPSLRRVLNATGIVLHTNLGRAPMSVSAQAAIARAASGYTNLEFDLATGERGSRHDHVERLICELTGAEAALVVNNGAAAVLLAAATLAGGRELVVSRGQLIEIGGSFRIPEVVVQAGARLVEVGTTNRTTIRDYAQAISPATAAVLRAHTSNFRTVGFVEQVEIEELCELGVPVIDDLGSGMLINVDEALADEPPVRRSVDAGATLICFSGDKLLGGPQAGLVVGRRAAVDAARRHPLARAVRIDKLCLAALEATLALYRDPELVLREIPIYAMLTVSAADLDDRARRLATMVGGEVVDSSSRVGGGTLPLLELPGPAVALKGDATRLAQALRRADPPLIGRINEDRLLLEVRTLADDEIEMAGRAVCAVLSGG
jgi:L-seryl-tRNA(Ser) seleniumtransferase